MMKTIHKYNCQANSFQVGFLDKPLSRRNETGYSDPAANH